MNSYLDTRISVYNGVTDNVGVICPLRAFLFSKRHKNDVERIRSLYGSEKYKQEKKHLPMAAISGTFKTRTLGDLIEHTGLICIDIDAKDNPNLDMNKDVMPILTHLPYVLYAGQSVSGNGYFAIIPLLHKGLHRQHYCSLKHEFLKMGIIIDKACGDVTRTRFISYDDNFYLNEDAEVYDGIESEQECHVNKVYSQTTNIERTPETGFTDLQKVELCVRLIEERHIDITEGYANWVSVGASLASLGEQGRSFYHRVSKQNPQYKYGETERKFTNVMTTMKRFNLGYFFEVCYRYGITFRDAFRQVTNV